FYHLRPHTRPTRLPYTTLFRSSAAGKTAGTDYVGQKRRLDSGGPRGEIPPGITAGRKCDLRGLRPHADGRNSATQCRGCTALSRSEEHTSELQSRENLVCRLLL